MQRVRILISQPILRLDCYNSSIREIKELNMTNIKTTIKTAFGRSLHYVDDPVYADALQRLTGKKTLNDLDIINLNRKFDLALKIKSLPSLELLRPILYFSFLF